jgi:lipopolysaccharide transport system ATP-binding protein
VLFVSHDVDAVQRLCADCIWLEQGRVAAYGGTAAVVRDYLSRVSGSVRARDWIDLRGRPRSGSGESRFTAARVLPVPGGLDGQPYPDGPLELVLEIESDAPRTIGSLAVSVESLTGAKLIEADILTIGQSVQLARGLTRVQFRIPSLHLNPGVYAIRLWLGHTATSGFDHLPVAFQLEVIRPTTMSTAQLPVTAGAVSCRFDVSAA